MTEKLIYLASPYTDKDKNVEERRYLLACKATADLINEDFVVYSPIVHHHPLAIMYDLPTKVDYWQRANEAILIHCERLYILQCDGWINSEGINREIDFADAYEIIIRLTRRYNYEELGKNYWPSALRVDARGANQQNPEGASTGIPVPSNTILGTGEEKEKDQDKEATEISGSPTGQGTEGGAWP